MPPLSSGRVFYSAGALGRPRVRDYIGQAQWRLCELRTEEATNTLIACDHQDVFPGGPYL